MRTFIITGLMLGGACLTEPAMAAPDSPAPAPQTMAGRASATPRPAMSPAMHRWGPRVDGRWYAGMHAPGGWAAYRRPVAGIILPRYWIQPSYYIGNYATYGLPAPREGYGWSRYYDDAVLTDRYGRVIDSRHDIAWDRYDGGYDDAPYGDEPRRRDDGLGGAVIGGVVGGVAGNRIAGRGNRTEGTIIGAGVGAIAGAAIDKAEDRRDRAEDRHPRRHDSPPPRAYDDDDRVTYNNEYDGRWVGTWHGDDGSTYSGEYRGRYEGTVPPPRAAHWVDGESPAYGHPGGYYANGYYYPAPTVTTIVIQPATTTSYVTEEVVYTAPRRSWKPRRVVPKARCDCK
ncbi:RcnB family protein [Sphingobium aquiterrae]|uniref:RcnB family protein n=1 Tax=Sphingobium aquiterrae TaxID=2038656 RepID=UPI00301AF42B